MCRSLLLGRGVYKKELTNKLDIDEYLERIHHTGSLEQSRNTLIQLQYAHMLAVPFENLSIAIGQPIVLTEEALFEKIVRQKRGGFCYELNFLFARLLEILGYRVTLLSAEVAHADGTFGPPFDHLTLKVDGEQAWLVDVGFGDSFRQPLNLESPEAQQQPIGTYRLIQRESHHILEELRGHAWIPQYRFTLEPHVITDFQSMCQFHQTSPASHFTRNRICSIATPAGRISLSGRKLIITDGDEREERLLATEETYSAALWEFFGIRLPGLATN
jgi:N-hydroxyarylamine O-acetyltransferase